MPTMTDRDALLTVVQRATGSVSPLRLSHSEVLVDSPQNMTTASLVRHYGELSDGTPWSVVAKTLRPASRSPLWEFVPEEFRATVLQNLDWHGEPRLYDLGLDAYLPAGMRAPTIWRIEHSDEAITIWMEDVPDHPSWDLGRYRRSAVALGKMAGRWPEPQAGAQLGLRRRNLHNLFFGKITNLDLQILAQDSFWASDPIVELEDHRLRADLFELAERMPALLDYAETLPHAMAHGDAAPANLLDPGDGQVVAIDWSYGSSAPVGSDLGQLLAGRYDSGEASPHELPELVPTIVDGFCEGLAAQGSDVSRDQVEAAFAIHLGVRTVFSLLVIESRNELAPDALEHLLAPRAALARAGLDLCAALVV